MCFVMNWRIYIAFQKRRLTDTESIDRKVVVANKGQEATAYGLKLLGSAGSEMGAGVELEGISQDAFLGSPALRIAGGTDEILRNTIGEGSWRCSP